MIKNERQYRITRAQADRFAEALRSLETDAVHQPECHPLLLSMQKDALQSQLSDLQVEIREYEALKAGDFAFEQLKGISELPMLLIRARIASGLSQRELADRLGLKEQQIQRYEATDYASASFTRIAEVVSALGMEIDESVLAEQGRASLDDVIDRASSIGLAPEFIRKRLLPRRQWQSSPTEDTQVGSSITVRTAAETLARVFRWSPEQLLAGEDLTLAPALASVRCKVASSANRQRVAAYTVYAHYLALLATQACADIPIKPIPTDPGTVRSEIESSYGSLSLAAIVNYMWDLGVVVLPLDDPEAFHGACFREDWRNVIVLTQKTSASSRWAFDCLHACWHAGQEPESRERTVLGLEEMSSEEPGGRDESTANCFAAAVLLNGRGQELAEKSLAEANYDPCQLKAAVQRVAKRESVSVAALANYLACRLADERGENWWGTANSLQSADDPWSVVRNVFFERADFMNLAEPDRELLAQALSPWEEQVVTDTDTDWNKDKELMPRG